MSESEPWMPVEGVTYHLGTKDAVRRWIEAHSLTARMVGRLWRIKLIDERMWAGGDASETGGAG